MKLKIYMKYVNIVVAILLIAGLTPFLTGCTLIGLTAGAVIDKSHHELSTIGVKRLQSIRPGKEVKIICYDRKILSGIYKGIAQVPFDQYREDYSKFKEMHPDDQAIPDIGDTLEVLLIKANELNRGLFRAFELSTILLEDPNKGRYFHASDNVDETVIYYNSRPFIIRNYPDLPSIKTILLDTGDVSLLSIRVDEVETIQVPYRYNGKLLGSLIGLGIDVAIVIILYKTVEYGGFGPMF